MIITSYSNIDLIQGVIGYGNAIEGITDWRIANTSNGIFNILNSSSLTANISIIDNGNIGIGTTPLSSSSKLEVLGDVNISGNYKLNNRDVINETSNYVLRTSNLLVPQIITEVGNGSNYISQIATQLNMRIDNTSNYVARSSNTLSSGTSNISSMWTNVSSGIHYTPIPSLAITSSPSATTVGTTGDYTYMSFTYTTETAGVSTGQSMYTINFPYGVVCDILVVGGGGGGDGQIGAGGGGGAVLYATNITIPTGSYIIKVGKGGTKNQNGSSSEAFGATCLGGGSTLFVEWGTANNGVSGGSGSGGSPGSYATAIGGTVGISTKGILLNSGIMYNGNIGGNGLGQQGGNTPVGGGGGGGAGTPGLSSTLVNYTTRSSWIAAGKPSNGGDGVAINIIGTTYYWGAGGGGGGFYTHGGDGGLGGGGGGGAQSNSGAQPPPGLQGIYGINNGGNGNTVDVTGGNGGFSTGSGGGGSSYVNTAGNGGSGIIIIKFLSSTRNVGIGTTNPTSELHVFDDTTTNTKLTVQNNFVEPIVISPNTIGYTVAETLESNKYYRTLTFNYFPNYPENPPNTALLAWYRFDGDGLDYNPYSTKYNLIAEEGTPTYSSGTTEDSFFQGRRYINTATGSLKTTTLSLASRAFSVSMWLRFKINGQGASILCQSTTQTQNTTLYIGARGNASYFLGFHANDLECGIGVSGSPTSYPGDVNTWVHLVYVVLPNYNRRIYRNGVLISSDSNTSAFTGTGDLSFNRKYWNGNAYVNMDVSDLRIYNNGLSATEVATLYASYMNLVITDNYSVNFKSSTTLLVNGASKIVNGAYTLSMGHLNDSMRHVSDQSDTPLPSTVLTSLPLKYEYSNTSLSLPALITVAGATSSFIGTTERGISFTYTSDSSGLTGQTQYSFTPTEDLWCDILIVGGGGGGGHGGGGGGGVLFGTNLKLSTGISVTVKVGNGGTGTTGGSFASAANGTNGFNSSIIINSIEYIAVGGGGGGTRDNNGSCPARSGNSGGSGGGGSHGNNAPYGLGGISNKNNYANFQSFGNNGGLGRQGTSGSDPNHTSGGGGGAGSIGADISLITGGGNGGRGKDFVSYFGTNVGHNGWFAGGGGGQTAFGGGNRGYGNGGLGLYGGGGDSANEYTPILLAHNGLSNTGGGGGGGRFQGDAYTIKGGAGGSGFVIIRYRKFTTQSASLELITAKQIPNELVVSGTTSTSLGAFERCIIFPYTTDTVSGSGQTQYNFSINEELNCDILIVAGGGSGGQAAGGGGGAGGLIYLPNQNITTGIYNVFVGRGGTATLYQNGFNSSFGTNIAIGGGVGSTMSGTLPGNGGSGGGGNRSNIDNASVPGQTGGSGTINQGNAGGTGKNFSGSNTGGGGGGGAGAAGVSAFTTGRGANGGIGLAYSITGTLTYYAGGGGGGSGSDFNTAGSGGLGGGGNGAIWANTGGNASANTGGGGGGGSAYPGDGRTGGNGGSGIVIIRYRIAKIGYQGYNIGNYNGDFKIVSSTYSTTSQDIDFMRITRDGASIYNPTGSPLWSTVSDRRIKENIEKASYDKCYESINKLELYRFSYIKELNNINKDLNQLGYIAQEVKDIYPKAVSTQEFYNENLSISDMLSIDITQINYSLYGAVKKLIEMYNDIEKQISILENILNIDNTIINVPIYTSITTSNLTLDTTTSNIIIDTTTCNIILDTTTCNIILDTTTCNIILDTTTSNIILDTTTSNLTLDTNTSNLTLDTTTSNLTLDTTTSNLTLDTTTSNLTLDTTTSNLSN
jgi:hypothetical protein